MTLVGICAECKDKKRPGRPFERRRLYRGPENRKLCHQHFIKAIDALCDLCGERGAVTYTPADDDICQECADEILANYTTGGDSE